MRMLAAFACLLALASCQKAPPSCCAGEAEAGAVDTRSLHLLESRYAASDGRTVTLAEVAGQARVLTLIYTNCEYVCPATIAELKRIRSALTPAQLRETRFVLVTMDPERDSPAVLRQYALDQGLGSDQWSLLSGDDDATRELAAALGFRFKKVGTGFSHSNAIYLLDRRGVVVHTRQGSGEVEPIRNAIAALMR